jgi:hypothetical protein
VTTRALTSFVFAVVVATLLSVSTTAAAFCRKTTAGGDECAHPPDALPLYWQNRCVALRVLVDPELERSGRMTLERATAIVERARTTWTTAECHGRKAAIELADVGGVGCSDRLGTRNEIHFAATPADPGLLGATDVSFDSNTGAISLARVNIPDVYDELEATDAADLDARVEGVVRHELGHFLGLAHSDDEHAVMAASYDPTRKDGLTADDLQGLCDAYDPAQPIGAGCTLLVAPRDPSTVASGAIVVGVVLLLRRRRRWRRRHALLLALAFVLCATPVEAANAKKRKPAPKPTSVPVVPVPSTEDTALLGSSGPTLASPLVAYALPAEPSAPPAPSAAPAAAETAPSSLPALPARTAEPSELWLGARYRASLLPSSLLGPIATTNADLLFHSAAVELEIRRARFSFIPAVTFTDLATRDLLVGRPNASLASDFSYVKSDLQALAASLTVLYSWPVSPRVSLEVGAEVGLGTTLGSLRTSWVHESANGPLAYGDRRFTPCSTVEDGFGCRPQDHEPGGAMRVGVHDERGPILLPWVSLPLVGLRARLTEDVAARINVGVSVTGVSAGVALYYGK